MIRRGEVRLWTLPLSDDAVAALPLAALAQWLAADELARAQRFATPAARTRFIVTRAALRGLLGACTGAHPAGLRLVAGRRGKPALLDAGSGGAAAELEFNLSHTDGLVVFAVTRGAPVGVDVEACRSLPDLDALAERTLGGAEHAAWAALAPDSRETAFYRAWTRKEACVKASGDGLWASLEAFDVGFSPGRLGQVTAVGRCDGWSLFDLGLDTGHCAALACADGWQPAGPPSPLDLAALLSGDAASATAT